MLKTFKSKIIAGIVAFLFGVTSLNTDLLYGLANGNWSLSRSHGWCASDIGTVAQLSSQKISSNCGTIAGAYWVSWMVLLAGVALIAWGAWQRRSQVIRVYQRNM